MEKKTRQLTSSLGSRSLDPVLRGSPARLTSVATEIPNDYVIVVQADRDNSVSKCSTCVRKFAELVSQRCGDELPRRPKSKVGTP